MRGRRSVSDSSWHLSEILTALTGDTRFENSYMERDLVGIT